MKIRKVQGVNLAADFWANSLLSLFYGVEMGKQLSWSEDERSKILQIIHAMIVGRQSVMLIAENESGKPFGMLVYTKTSNKKARRLEALVVAEPFRGKGIARCLFFEAKEGCDFHSYSTPDSVGWHKKNGFFEIGKTKEGTIEMSTTGEIPDYDFKLLVPSVFRKFQSLNM